MSSSLFRSAAAMVEPSGAYVDLPLGGTDASLIALAERLQQNTIATLDRRHFSVVRPAHVAGFQIVPSLEGIH